MDPESMWNNVALSSSAQHLFTGDGSSAEIGARLLEIGIAPGRVALVADRDVSALGLTQGIRASLEDAGHAPAEYRDIAGEPDEDTAERLVAWLRELDAVAVVGVGGGSAMDLAKLAAALVTNPGRVRDYVGAGKVRRPPLPLALIPTTAGTGSEATRNAILGIDGFKAVITSPLLEPRIAVLDPLLTLGLPPGVTAATGLDALTHAIEPYLSTFANPFTDEMALAAMRRIAPALPVAARDGGNLGARRAMLFGAYLAGLSLNASTLLGHSMAYTIANRTHLPHGVTCAMALPYCVAYNAQAAAPRVRAAAQAVTGRAGASAEDLVGWARMMQERLSVPVSLREVGLGVADVPKMVEECMVRYPRANNPEPFERERLTQLYRHLLDGDMDALFGMMRTQWEEA